MNKGVYMSVIVTATFDAKIGHEDALFSALEASLPAVHEEPGCITFALHRSETGNPVLIENWENTELLETHLSGQPVAALVERIQPHLAADPVVVRLTPVPVGAGNHGTI